MKRVALTAGLLALVLAACGEDEGGGAAAPTTTGDAPAAAGAQGPTVEIKTFIFSPDPIEVQAGDTVTFINRDATTHTVVGGTRKSPDKAAIDGSLDQDGTFEHTFDEPGTFDYFCDIHSGPGMTGKVVVS